MVERSHVRLGGPDAVPRPWAWAGCPAVVELLGQEGKEVDADQREYGEGV